MGVTYSFWVSMAYFGAIFLGAVLLLARMMDTEHEGSRERTDDEQETDDSDRTDRGSTAPE
jgi:hypothetical protein